VVPAWALEVAAEVVGATVQDLLDGAERASTAAGAWRDEIVDAIGRLEAEMTEVRQRLELPWESGDGEDGEGEAPPGRTEPAS
jgi:hypothetical protein